MRRKDFAFAVFFFVGAICAFPQTSQAPATPASVPSFQFHLRTAFMLTPAMVAFIQSASTHSQDAKSAQNMPSDKDGGPVWNEPIVRDVSFAASLAVKIQGDQLIAMIVFMPVEYAKKDITLLVQNQVYARSPDNSIQLNTSVHTIRIPLGSVFYYYPLGGDSKQGAPVVIEILVNQK